MWISFKLCLQLSNVIMVVCGLVFSFVYGLLMVLWLCVDWFSTLSMAECDLVLSFVYSLLVVIWSIMHWLHFFHVALFRLSGEICICF